MKKEKYKPVRKHLAEIMEKEKYKPDLNHLAEIRYTFPLSFTWSLTREGFKYWNNVRNILARMTSAF